MAISNSLPLSLNGKNRAEDLLDENYFLSKGQKVPLFVKIMKRFPEMTEKEYVEIPNTQIFWNWYKQNKSEIKENFFVTKKNNKWVIGIKMYNVMSCLMTQHIMKEI